MVKHFLPLVQFVVDKNSRGKRGSSCHCMSCTYYLRRQRLTHMQFVAKEYAERPSALVAAYMDSFQRHKAKE